MEFFKSLIEEVAETIKTFENYLSLDRKSKI